MQIKIKRKLSYYHQKKNLGLINNFIRTYKECNGKYVAICDGDDFWVDPLKLQKKQVDFLKSTLPSQSFDYVVGKAFLHHLTIPTEKFFLKETVRLLNHDGEARFFEPAVNSKFLDEIRWHIPIGGGQAFKI